MTSQQIKNIINKQIEEYDTIADAFEDESVKSHYWLQSTTLRCLLLEIEEQEEEDATA